MTKNIHITRDKKLHQCDILKDYSTTILIYTDNTKVSEETYSFDNIIILTQECDLLWDYDNRLNLKKHPKEDSSYNKLLFSCLVAPLYVADMFLRGEHLKKLKRQMEIIIKSKTKMNFILNNEIPRYHYIKFPDDFTLNDQIIDFKHFFSVNVQELEDHKNNNFVCRLKPLYRDDILRRFANYLSRIALP